MWCRLVSLHTLSVDFASRWLEPQIKALTFSTLGIEQDWVNYNDLTRPHPKLCFMWGIAPQPPYFRLVNYYNSLRTGRPSRTPREDLPHHGGHVVLRCQHMPGPQRDGWAPIRCSTGLMNPWLINRGMSPFSGDSDHFWREHPPYWDGFINPGATLATPEKGCLVSLALLVSWRVR